MTRPHDLFTERKVRSSHIARELGLTHGTISQWKAVPVHHVLDVERLTGIPRHELRPDIYPPADAKTQPPEEHAA